MTRKESFILKAAPVLFAVLGYLIAVLLGLKEGTWIAILLLVLSGSFFQEVVNVSQGNQLFWGRLSPWDKAVTSISLALLLMFGLFPLMNKHNDGLIDIGVLFLGVIVSWAVHTLFMTADGKEISPFFAWKKK